MNECQWGGFTTIVRQGCVCVHYNCACVYWQQYTVYIYVYVYTQCFLCLAFHYKIFLRFLCFYSDINCAAACLVSCTCLSVSISLSRVCLCPHIICPSFFSKVYRHTQTLTHTLMEALSHKRRSVWRMKLFSVNRLRSLSLSPPPQDTYIHLSRFLSIFFFPVHSYFPFLFHLSHSTSPSHFSSLASTLSLVISSDSVSLSSSPLFFVMFCRPPPQPLPPRRGEWISKLIPDSCSGWWATLQIRIENSASDLGQFFSILVFRKHERIIKIPGPIVFYYSQRHTTHFLSQGRTSIYPPLLSISLCHFLSLCFVV